MPVVKDWLTKSVKGIIRYSLMRFIKKLEISSFPELFPGAKSAIILEQNIQYKQLRL